MKKKLRKIFAAVLVVAILFTTTVFAQGESPLVVTLYPKSAKVYDEFIRNYGPANRVAVTSFAPGEGLTITNLKSTNKSVASPFVKKGTGVNKGGQCVYLNVKKPGSTTVSWKYKEGGGTHQKYVVKKYVSPFASLKLGRYNLTSKFKKTNTYIMNYSRFKNKKFKVNYKAKKDWDIDLLYMKKPGDWRRENIKNGQSFKVSGKNSALLVFALNKKTNQIIYGNIIFK